LKHARRYQLVNPVLRSQLRNALDNLAQDLLDMSQYLSKINGERQLLLDRRSNLTQILKRTSGKGQRQLLAEDFAKLSESIQNLDAKLIDARQQRLPVTESRFFIRLKRLHGRLPGSKPHGFIISSNSFYKAILSGNKRLRVLLSLPVANTLDALAHHLLTSSFPFTEESFFIMIKKLTALRYASMARSAYHHLIEAGYIPLEKPMEISSLLKLANVISDRRGFHRILRSVRQSGIPSDRYIYGALVIGFLKMGNPPRAIEQFKAMLSDGIQPPLSLLTYILRDCASRRNWELGKTIWHMFNIGQLRGALVPDKWIYYEMWTLCQRCAKYYNARSVRQEALEHGIDIGDIVKRPPLKRRPVRRSNKSPQLLHYYDSFLNRNFETALYFEGHDFGGRSSKHKLKNSSKLAKEEVQRLVMHRQQGLRGSPKYLDALGREPPPEPFKTPYGKMATSLVPACVHGDDEFADIIEEASADYFCSVKTSEKLLDHHLVEARVAKGTKTSIFKAKAPTLLEKILYAATNTTETSFPTMSDVMSGRESVTAKLE
jgi:hypothetical protein